MPTISKVIPEPDLRSVLDLLKREILTELNCHAVGTIQLFDPVTQTAKVSINYRKTYFVGANGDKEAYVDYPVLLDVPIVVLSGGLLAALTLPIMTGDTCVLLFNDRDISKWLATGQVGPVPSFRLHNMSDAIALVGIRSAINPVLPYDPINASLQYGPSSVKVGPAGVVITSGPVVMAFPAAGGAMSMTSPLGAIGMSPAGKIKLENTVTTLLQVLEGLIDVVKGLQTITVTTSELANVTAASQATLEGYKTTLQGLLE